MTAEDRLRPRSSGGARDVARSSKTPRESDRLSVPERIAAGRGDLGQHSPRNWKRPLFRRRSGRRFDRRPGALTRRTRRRPSLGSGWRPRRWPELRQMSLPAIRRILVRQLPTARAIGYSTTPPIWYRATDGRRWSTGLCDLFNDRDSAGGVSESHLGDRPPTGLHGGRRLYRDLSANRAFAIGGGKIRERSADTTLRTERAEP